MFQYGFDIATRVLLCKSNRWKLENMKNEPNNTHIPYSPPHVKGFYNNSIIQLYRTIINFEMVLLSEDPCSCYYLGPTLPLFSSPFGAFVLPPSIWIVGHLAGVSTVHNCGQKSFWCKRIIHGNFFISCIHILKHTCSVVIFPGVSGRNLLSKDLQLYTKCWSMCRECFIAYGFFASLDNWHDECWGKARWWGLAL